MKKRLCSVLLAFSLLFLASCGHRQTVGDGGAATEPLRTELTEQTKATEPTEWTELTEQTEPTEWTELTEQTEPTEQTEATEPTEQTETTGFAPVSDYSGAKALGRPEHARLRYYGVAPQSGPAPRLESEATLYIGDGYSIYIMDEEWVYQTGTMGERHADIWKNVLNEKTEMRIVNMGNLREAQDWDRAQDWVREQYPEYELDACECGALSNNGDDIMIDVEFHCLGDNVYAAIEVYEDGNLDRYGHPMRVMFQTLRPFFHVPTAEELGRPEHMQLTCRAGGEKIASEASLYVGSSYSIYVPDEDWTAKTGIMEWKTVGAWKSTLYGGVELRIESDKQYIDDIREANPGYVVTEGENEVQIGENAEGFRMEAIWVSELYDGEPVKYTIYKVYSTADAKEAERAKAMLDAMADTFKPFKNKVSYNLMHF